MTQSELARQLGIRRQVVSYHVGKGGCPPLDAPNAVELWKEFLAADARDGGIGPLPEDLRLAIGQARLKLLEAQSEREQLRLRKEQDEICDRRVVQQAAGQIMTAIFDSLTRQFEFEFPGAVVGKDEPAIACEARRRISELRTGLAVQIESIGQGEPA